MLLESCYSLLLCLPLRLLLQLQCLDERLRVPYCRLWCCFRSCMLLLLGQLLCWLLAAS
jgi:hypothetical protein